MEERRNSRYFPLSELTLRYSARDLPEEFALSRLYVTVDDDLDAEVNNYVCDKAAESGGSESCLAEAREWLRDCLENHTACRTALSRHRFSDTDETTQLPARVIDVGSAPDFRPFLVETQGKLGRYVALSYCWEPLDAENPRITLLRENKEALKKDLPLDGLPPTIQDSIDFTRRLGLQYVWIDRLCIVQNDPDDWAVQANLMCNIYEGALVTLVAMASETTEHGLYFPRVLRPSVRIPCATKERTIGTMNVTYPGNNGAVIIGRTFSKEVRNSRWASRGWTFQEGLLSRRQIYFGQHQLFWECQKTACDEIGLPTYADSLSASLRDIVDDKWRTKSTKWLSSVSSPSPNGAVASTVSAFVLEHLRYWRECILIFQARELTVKSDKPMAMKGIARAIQGSLGWADMTYSFGVFSKAAYFGLLWNPRGALVRPQQPRAPSWSWMAYDGQLEIPGPNERNPDSNLLRDCAFISEVPPTVGCFTDFLSNASDPVCLKVTGPMVALTLHSGVHPAAAAADIQEWTQWSSDATDRLLFKTQSRLHGTAKRKFTHFWPPEFIKLAGLIADAPGFRLDEYFSSHQNLYTLTDGRKKLCGCVMFDFDGERLMGSAFSFLVVSQDVDLFSIRVRRRRRVYYLLALEQIATGDSHPPVYRRVGVAQTVFVEDIGSPLHEWWTMQEILIV